MEPFRLHIFICDQQKPEGVPSCSHRGSARTIDALRREIGARGLLDEVQLTVCGSLGVCERGPNMVVYPEGVWYSGVSPEDVPEIVESHFVKGEPATRLMNADPEALKTEIRWNRDRMLASLRARDKAGVLPDDLNQAVRGYQESRILLTALELDFFSLAGEGATAEAIAEAAGTDARATERLLDALAALGLLTKSSSTFACTPVSRRFLTSRGADTARLALLHHQSLWMQWSHLTECVRTGSSPALAQPSDRGDEATRWFIAAMHRNAAERAPLVVMAVGAGGIRRMLDVGGGSGAYSIAFARANDELQADILDVAPVLPITEQHIESAGLSLRVRVRAGDLRSGDLGTGYDLVFLSAICHM
ncbi:MAG: hypothetical protein L6R30_14730, partial [Thermoanaerobaculia bacterium]|nr:hypothetical protein [Thermoanaerobaculia bacterium]